VEFVATIISSNNVHQQNILGLLVQPRNTNFELRKHLPVQKRGRENKNGNWSNDTNIDRKYHITSLAHNIATMQKS
jgi:hypothetical protein